MRRIIYDASSDIVPARGDRLQAPRSIYWVLSVSRVKSKRYANRYKLLVALTDHVEPELKFRLVQSATRCGYSRLLPIYWYSSKHKPQPS